MEYILASASPRRVELLTQMGLEIEVMPSNADESTDQTDAARIVEELSIAKCQEVARRLEGIKTGDYCIIGADTVVALDNEVLGKPKDEADAKRMLSLLSGNTHQVFTGVTVLVHLSGVHSSLVTFHEQTDVTMYELPEEQINNYVATGEPMDKAGAYGIQGRGAVLIHHISGDYCNVVGLPIARLFHELCKLGIE